MNDWAPVLMLPLWAWLFVIPSMGAVVCYIWKEQAKAVLRPVWRLLDHLYNAAGALAAVFMITILLIIVVQMYSRWTGSSFQGSTKFAGYAMAATSFFAFAYALNRGAHIRVSIALNINAWTRLWVDAYAMWIGALIATYFARYAVKTNIMSEMLNDRTQDQDQVPEWFLAIFSFFSNAPSKWADIWNTAGTEWVYTPVWLPQLPMSIGSILLAIALWDNLYRLLVNKTTSIVSEVVE